MAAVPITNIPDPSSLSDSQLLRHIFTSVTRMEATLSAQQTRIKELEDTVDTLTKDVYFLKNQVNRRDQADHGLNVRISGFAYTDEEKTANDSKYLPKKVYERLLQPILLHAKSVNLIDKVPIVSNVVSSCYRLRANSALTGTSRPLLC